MAKSPSWQSWGLHPAVCFDNTFLCLQSISFMRHRHGFSASVSSIQLVQISPVPNVHSCTSSIWEKCSIHRSRCDKRPFDKVDIFVICCHCFRRNSQKFARNVFSQWDDILALLVTSWRGRTWVWLFVWCMFRNLRHLTVFKVWTATRSSKDPFMTFSSSSSVFP